MKTVSTYAWTAIDRLSTIYKSDLSYENKKEILLSCSCVKKTVYCPVGWGCRIYWQHLSRGVRPPPQRVSWYDTKQSDGKVPVMLELWGMQSTPLLPSLPGPLWPGVVAPDKGPIYGLNRTNGILMLNWIVWLNRMAWNRNVFDNLTVLTFKLRAYAKLNYFK